jgi:hypothetical protein
MRLASPEIFLVGDENVEIGGKITRCWKYIFKGS